MKPKFNEKKHSNFEPKFMLSELCRRGPTEYAMAARELRKDQDQPFFSHSQANLNTASAWGAPDLIALRIPPGMD